MSEKDENLRVERLRREYETPTVEEGFEEVEVWNL